MVKLYSIEYLVDSDGKRTAAVVPIATWKRLLSEVGLPDSGADTEAATIAAKLNVKAKSAKKKLGKAKAAKPKAEKPKEKGKPKKAALAPKKAKK
jgi:hypothetical protein